MSFLTVSPKIRVGRARATGRGKSKAEAKGRFRPHLAIVGQPTIHRARARQQGHGTRLAKNTKQRTDGPARST